MDDRRAQFLTTVGDVCVAAGLADIPVELALSDGTHLRGTPSPQPATPGQPSVGDTGYASLLRINGEVTQLERIVGLAIRSPSPNG